MMKYSSPLFQMKVLVDDKPVQEYHKDGKTFVEGRQGSRFMLELTNLTHRRILAHPTVDGLSVMTGKEASKNDNTEGYVLMPHQFLKIPGWRLDNDTVADFFFAGGGGSYAEKTGKPRNRGVIGCAVWEQKEIPPFFGFMHEVDPGPRSDEELTTSRFSSSSKATFDSFAPPAMSDEDIEMRKSISGSNLTPDMALNTSRRNEVKCSGSLGKGRRSRKSVTRSVQNLGTGFGSKTTHQVQEVTFLPASEEPVLIAAIYYDDYEGLRAKGLKLPRRGRRQQPSMPDPFPKATGCKPPAGWRG